MIIATAIFNVKIFDIFFRKINRFDATAHSEYRIRNSGDIKKAERAQTRSASLTGDANGQPPKSSSMMFSRSTPMSSSILMTAVFIMGGPQR